MESIKTLGPYQIQAEIGRGGMATIYRAYDPRCGRWVALKVLPAYFQHNREFVARFAREAHNAAALAHPHIVPVYESGATAEQPYIAMAWADGGSLAEQLARRRGPLPLGQVADVLRQVASALDYAHARGVVHRDIKPANILLTRQGHAMLADFGIAKAVWESGLTQSGVRLGTPAYMAPEQARGGGVDARTDLYALGVVLYEMLTGAPPFQGDTDAVLYQHVHEPPPRLRARNPALPPALEKVVRRALEKDPRRRYGSGDELAAAFCAALPGTGPRGATPAPQNWPAGVGPAPVLLGLLGLALLVALFACVATLLPSGGRGGAELSLDVQRTQSAVVAATTAAAIASPSTPAADTAPPTDAPAPTALPTDAPDPTPMPPPDVLCGAGDCSCKAKLNRDKSLYEKPQVDAGRCNNIAAGTQVGVLAPAGQAAGLRWSEIRVRRDDLNCPGAASDYFSCDADTCKGYMPDFAFDCIGR